MNWAEWFFGKSKRQQGLGVLLFVLLLTMLISVFHWNLLGLAVTFRRNPPDGGGEYRLEVFTRCRMFVDGAFVTGKLTGGRQRSETLPVWLYVEGKRVGGPSPIVVTFTRCGLGWTGGVQLARLGMSSPNRGASIVVESIEGSAWDARVRCEGRYE